MTTLYKNPTYILKENDWRMWQDLYDGDHNTMVTKYLWKHENEQKDEGKHLLAIRKQRTRYLNIQEILVSVWRSLFFRKDGAPDSDLGDLLGEDIEDIDKERNSLQTFISEKVLTNYLNLGAVCIIADAPDGERVSAADEQARGLRPYLKSVHPLDVKDWQFESVDPKRWGKLNMLRYEYLVEPPRGEEDEPKKVWYSDAYVKTIDGSVELRRYRGKELLIGNGYLATASSALSDDGWELEKTIALKHSEIPAVLWFGESWLKDAAQETLRHFNLRSALDNVNHYQGYQKLFIKGGTNMSEQQRKALAEYIMGLLSEGQDVVAIDPVDPVGLEKACKEALENAFKVGLNQLRALPSDSKEGMSAEAMSEQKRATIDLVLSAIKELEQITNEALKHYAGFKDKKYTTSKFAGRFDLSKEIEPINVNALITEFNMLGDALRANPEWEKALLTKIARAQEFGDQEQEAILAAIQPRSAPQAQTQRVEARTNFLRGVLNGGQTNGAASAQA